MFVYLFSISKKRRMPKPSSWTTATQPQTNILGEKGNMMRERERERERDREREREKERERERMYLWMYNNTCIIMICPIYLIGKLTVLLLVASCWNLTLKPSNSSFLKLGIKVMT